MAQRKHKETMRKSNNVITINPLKEFPSRPVVDKSRRKPMPIGMKAPIKVEEFTTSHIIDKSKRWNEEIKDTIPVDETASRKGIERTTDTNLEVIYCPSARQSLPPTHLPTVKRYEIKPIIPAQKKELIPVAKAMHRKEFGSRLHALFQPEKVAALDAIESGVYIGWRCEEYTWDCIRLGRHSRCFCDHTLNEHEPYNGKSIQVKCQILNCSCKAFSFIPERPQDIGEWWLPKRPGFDLATWRAKCKCKHTHTTHDAQTKICSVRGCNCFSFKSDFLCAACDRHWEDHWTFFDTVMSRKEKKLPVGNEYLPFHEMTDLRDVILNGEKECVGVHRGRIQNAINGSKSQISGKLRKSSQEFPRR